MRVVIFVLLSIVMSSVVFAEDAKIKAIKDQIENVAALEFKALNLSFESKEGKSCLLECENNYNLILELVNTLSEEETRLNNIFLSRVYDRCGWFLCRNRSSKYLPSKLANLLTKAIELDSQNYIAHFKYAMLNKKSQINLYREHLLKSFELKNDFAEVNFELGFCFYNNSREPDLVKKHQTLFFQNMKNYSPELCYFDIGFPAKKIEQFGGFSEEEIEMLKRKEYYDIKDKSRFALNVLKMKDQLIKEK